MAIISELLDLPEQVHSGDFVLKLSEVSQSADAILRDYVVTEQLQAAFDDALKFIKSAVVVPDARENFSSKAAFLHGSFGSGKSHFMATLLLLLQHNPAARGIRELASVVASHDWAAERKFLLIPVHMINAMSVESAIFEAYTEQVKRQHPGVSWPGVYVADSLFEDAKRYLADAGEVRFFERLNEGNAVAKTKWGKLAAGWDRDSFDQAMKAPPNDPRRIQLVGDLVKNVFPALATQAASQGELYINFDDGLGVLSQHARSLGYHGLILFLDEMVLWLASRAADIKFVQQEAQKLVKLVEGGDHQNRKLPIVSFVARQRDLRDLVGQSLPGVEQLNFSEIIGHWEARFHKITLEDRNLPEIARKRVLRTKGNSDSERDANRLSLESSFKQATQLKSEILDILKTHGEDLEYFRNVYPFSAALVKTLVAVSSLLQRERTALKIMLQLLVKQRKCLRLGDFVPVGDLWDLVAEGDESVSDALKEPLQNARRLYNNKLRPILEETHGMSAYVAWKQFLAGPEVEPKVRAFIADDRILKTLLLASLVPDVETLRNLTPSRLSTLNFGNIKSPIPGKEASTVHSKLRNWASQVGEIRLADDAANPVVSLHVVGVDTDRLIMQAKQFDNSGERIRKIREILFSSLGVPQRTEAGAELQHTFSWRGSRRTATLLFANVRDLNDESFRNHTENWRVIVDWPFDTEGRDPVEDFERLERFRSKAEPSNSIVWLPQFFSPKVQEDLGKLVVIEKLLNPENLEKVGAFLSQQDRVTAHKLLEGQFSALKTRITQAIEAAYGLPGTNAQQYLDMTQDYSDRRVQSLVPGFSVQLPTGGSLREALQNLLDQALAHEFPDHPRLGVTSYSRADLKKVLEGCMSALRAKDGRAPIERSVRNLMKDIAEPLNLGVMGEDHFVVGSFWKANFEQQAAREGKSSSFSIAEVKNWFDKPRARGLPDDIENLIIMVFAEQTNRSFLKHGGPLDPSLDSIPDIVELQLSPLPSEADWLKARKSAQDLFGIPTNRGEALTATNLRSFGDEIRKKASDSKTAIVDYAHRLPEVFRQARLADNALECSDRYRTARAAVELIGILEEQDLVLLITGLANARLETSAPAMGRVLSQAAMLSETVKTTGWSMFENVALLAEQGNANCQAFVERLHTALTKDEHVLTRSLKQELRELDQEAAKLLRPPSPPKGTEPVPVPQPPAGAPPPQPRPGRKITGSGELVVSSREELTAKLRDLESKISLAKKGQLVIRWTLEEET